MKRMRSRIILICVWAIALAAIAVMLYLYSSSVSEKLYDEAKQNFSEVYEQVDSNFLNFMDDTWKNLTDWGPYIHDLDDSDAAKYINDRREVWGFSRFLFLNRSSQAITTDGERVNLQLGESEAELFAGSGKIMDELGLDTSSPETIFASASTRGTYRGFRYQAVAVTYTNEDLSKTINTDSFGGQSIGFVIYPDGKIALSTQEGGNVFSNYLVYLKAGSDLTEQQLEDLRLDWEAGKSGVLMCSLNDEEYYVSYQPLGYRDYILLGVVPASAVSGSFRNLQEMTIDVLVKIFVILAILIAIQVYLTQRRRLKKSKAEIEYRDVLFDLLSENLNDIFVVIDSDTLKISYITPNVERLLGMDPDVARTSLYSLREGLAHKNSAVSVDLLKSIEFGERHEILQEWINQKDGSHHWFREAIYHLNIQGDEKFIFIMSDRTEDRIMSQSLEDALSAAKNANEAKSQFLSNMSHDIRTPMNAIMGFTSLLQDNAENPERVREYIRKISASSKHLLSLINDVLDMSKIESGKTELSIVEFSLAEMLEEINAIMAPQASAKDQKFVTKMEGHPAEYLLGDKLRINQILINLLSNAVKYTQNGGEIEFVIKELPSNNNHYNNIKFIVKDNGMGMTEEYMKVIFDPFTRETNSVTNAIQGTGLGMAITKNIIDLMGGTIKVDSKLGEGSTFEVELSLGVSEANDRERYWHEKPGFRIFVVDDEEYICQDVQNAMKKENVEVDYATDGETAVRIVGENLERGIKYDVALIDWRMPGQSGETTARRIRELVGHDCFIFVLSSYDWADIETDAIEIGVDGYIPKPFFVTSLNQKLTMLENGSDDSEEPEIQSDILNGLNILVVEDNDLSAEMLIERLELEGATIERARNGREGVDVFEASEPGTYDLILMDVQMPIMGGHDATRTIRAGNHQEAKSIPIFAMTANVFAEDVRDALDAGMNVHIPKPIEMDVLRKMADQELNRKENDEDEN